MQSIIEKLFYETVEFPNLEQEKKISKKESEFYEKLRSGLTEEQKTLLIEFDDAKNERYLKEEKEFYTLGFRKGVQTILEILDIHLENKKQP